MATQSQKGVGVAPTQPINDVHFTNFHPQPQNPGNYENSNWNSRNHSHSRTTSGHPMKPEVTGNGEFDYNYSHLKQNQPMQEQSSVVMVSILKGVLKGIRNTFPTLKKLRFTVSTLVK